MRRVDQLLAWASARLEKAGSPSARLDAEVLLCQVLQVDRTWLYTWNDHDVAILARARFEALVAARAVGQPIAHLTGEREFWGLPLKTSADTLIPRPDTETLVEAALELAPGETGRLLDLGTGTGAIALAFASERPDWHITGVDIRPEAVTLARCNAERLCIANATFFRSDWFESLKDERGVERFDLIVSNPPYIAADDAHLRRGDLRFEPHSALVAGEGGLADLRHLAGQARRHLLPGGWLLLEHGFDQAGPVREALTVTGLLAVQSRHDLAGHERVSLGEAPR
ncbi:peptide chain release factor N(5)-glutamine methyltransferase [Halomonas sp. TRM85114]|uniref:peptide chain release factor N(5)-glutamine methyltransferase n=1 Tax=Halomonas jincaotanensis TaxID=2810616 RepID=UPI001BD5B2C3|nr:peptide chain release factor N(5)-glutamine methyltransferase [Halomonas jincaotanensis]MBS9402021.1 peptide chain release factor N(5)-glutamine methyltransferase [Halomonas jincaotanensis]